MITNEEYECAWKNNNNKMIMHAACKFFVGQLNEDEILECKLMALWESLKRWNPRGGSLFTSFLYRTLYWQCLKTILLKKNDKKMPINNIDNLDKVVLPQPTTYEILDGLPEDLQDILTKKYIDGMTLREIGNKYNCCYETIRKKIKKAKKQLKMLTKGV